MRNPPLPKISTFSPNKHFSHNKLTFFGLKKCAYYEWAQYLTSLKLSSRVIYYVPKIILIATKVYNFDGDFRLVRFAIFRNWF